MSEKRRDYINLKPLRTLFFECSVKNLVRRKTLNFQFVKEPCFFLTEPMQKKQGSFTNQFVKEPCFFLTEPMQKKQGSFTN